ncbi:MAG: 2Fe-2S iron-sulfur cluster-binding protein [Actinomycetota bacterium]|nr:2Fe-2S iron-sulfur cluster-binding protein [Actinomycetota bacterium]
MVRFILDGQSVEAEEGWTILETAKYYGIDIPTLCYHEGLSTYSACRICSVEIIRGGRSRLSASCSYPVQEGIEVRTNSERVRRARKILIELLLSSCPNSRTLQCLASEYGVTKIRFRAEDRGCILCGLCVRMCEEQMQAGAIGFVYRGVGREVAMPFHQRSDICRECGACLYICPVCELPCGGPLQPGQLCNACLDTVQLDPFPCRD